MFFETDALVIRTSKTLNNDLFLTLFSKKAGKMDVVANGAKSSKSQLAACSKPFVFGTFILNTHNKVMKVSSCEIVDSHFRIVDRLDTLAYGNYFLELCNLITVSNVVDVTHYQLIVEIISILASKAAKGDDVDIMSFELLRLAYLIKLSVITGHSPNLTNACSSCGKEAELLHFSVNAGGIVCNDCDATLYNGYKLNAQMINLIKYLEVKDVRVIDKTKIHENYIKYLMTIFEAFIDYHMGIKEIKSKSFFSSI